MQVPSRPVSSRIFSPATREGFLQNVYLAKAYTLWRGNSPLPHLSLV